MIVSIRYAFFASFLMVAGVAFAKDVDIRLLKDGMQAGEVISAIGAPLEKQEFETKREELWIYKNTELRFREGRLNLPKMKEPEVKVKKEDIEEDVQVKKRDPIEDWGAVTPVNDTVELKDILKGMTKYIDNGKDKKDNKNNRGVVRALKR